MANEHYTHTAIPKPIILSVCTDETFFPLHPTLSLFLSHFLTLQLSLDSVYLPFSETKQMRLCNMLKDINIKRTSGAYYENREEEEKIFAHVMHEYLLNDRLTAFQRSHLFQSTNPVSTLFITLYTIIIAMPMMTNNK